MSAGDIDDKEEPISTLARLRIENPEFDEYLMWARTIKPIRTFFVPFGAGASEDGTTVYISYDIQTTIDNIDYESALVIHETTEWALRKYLGIGDDYSDDPLGHRIANSAEFSRVRTLGGGDAGLDIYKEIIDSQVFNSERMDITGRPIPRDLALYPYQEDTSLCDKLQEEMFNDRSDEEWYKLHPPEDWRHTIRAANVEITSYIQDPPKAVDDRLTRDCFIYLDPKQPDNLFAQCFTCRMWVYDDHCTIHGPDVKVTETMSCALYIHGAPSTEGTPTEAIVTPTESGLVDRQVRCENCRWFYNPRQCNLFDLLNKAHPHDFNLDTQVHSKGCCNAQQPLASTNA